MAIKGSYLWRGLDLPEAYVRIVNISGNPREGFHVEFAIFSSPEFAAVDENKYKGLQVSKVHIITSDPTQIFSAGYAALKELPELAHFVDC